MLLKRWNAREVVEIGMTLADCFRPKGEREARAHRETRPFGIHQCEPESFLQRMTREVGA